MQQRELPAVGCGSKVQEGVDSAPTNVAHRGCVGRALRSSRESPRRGYDGSRHQISAPGSCWSQAGPHFIPSVRMRARSAQRAAVGLKWVRKSWPHRRETLAPNRALCIGDAGQVLRTKRGQPAPCGVASEQRTSPRNGAFRLFFFFCIK